MAGLLALTELRQLTDLKSYCGSSINKVHCAPGYPIDGVNQAVLCPGH
jgi:hypothetical protein